MPIETISRRIFELIGAKRRVFFNFVVEKKDKKKQTVLYDRIGFRGGKKGKKKKNCDLVGAALLVARWEIAQTFKFR